MSEYPTFFKPEGRGNPVVRGAGLKRGAPLKAKSDKQALLDERWSALREMYIHLAKQMSLEEDLFRCVECGRWAPPKGHGYPNEGLWGQAHHIIPRSKSGHYTARNFAWLCSERDDSCHSAAHNNNVRWGEKDG